MISSRGRGRGKGKGDFSSSRPAFHSSPRNNLAGEDDSAIDECFSGRNFGSHRRGTNSQQNLRGSFSRNVNGRGSPRYVYKPKKSPGDEKKSPGDELTCAVLSQQEKISGEARGSIDNECSLVSGSVIEDDSVPWSSHLSNEKQTSIGKSSNYDVTVGDLEQLEQVALVEPFDICPPKAETPFMLKPSLLVKNRERRNEIKRATKGISGSILRPGMVLLKGYLSMDDQIKIVTLCRNLGLRSGGFYQPGYRDGKRLHLKMMCLGKNWDPDTSQYGEYRPIDGSKTPTIPHELHFLVEKVIKDSHALIESNARVKNAEDDLPWMSPNICIVNFYSASGRLGLHQDKDESQESLRQGLPVVSFSIGDSGEFLYGDQRDVEKAKKLVLDSGDVVIFGGISRHIFHGVSSILPNTAPKSLLEETNLRAGRLNLTFRKY
ncbi:hypothetical protein K2173_024663 [Erythroxylum novogranatense]|uniref:DNA N(6)-methyladenine demethylase n=1 Tax=Erythroxylum novogranatense TaxID=1862640 RepID=A0AAV8SUZ6_9ROSI|nr:hypothetical protein K2173_024663 [Erythroxylum novogranatense]